MYWIIWSNLYWCTKKPNLINALNDVYFFYIYLKKKHCTLFHSVHNIIYNLYNLQNEAKDNKHNMFKYIQKPHFFHASIFKFVLILYHKKDNSDFVECKQITSLAAHTLALIVNQRWSLNWHVDGSFSVTWPVCEFLTNHWR